MHPKACVRTRASDWFLIDASVIFVHRLFVETLEHFLLLTYDGNVVLVYLLLTRRAPTRLSSWVRWPPTKRWTCRSLPRSQKRTTSPCLPSTYRLLVLLVLCVITSRIILQPSAVNCTLLLIRRHNTSHQPNCRIYSNPMHPGYLNSSHLI